ncbi:hypothetical protein RB195_005247 [Necator americanus]|uniref:Uncharacterized protein n=1 Tax=Necator americanus TaxID=51031 RepID=A0ABR1BR09_NECAM
MSNEVLMMSFDLDLTSSSRKHRTAILIDCHRLHQRIVDSVVLFHHVSAAFGARINFKSNSDLRWHKDTR